MAPYKVHKENLMQERDRIRHSYDHRLLNMIDLEEDADDHQATV